MVLSLFPFLLKERFSSLKVVDMCFVALLNDGGWRAVSRVVYPDDEYSML
jgi:hypothetical protein